jgi:hypothetical protein
MNTRQIKNPPQLRRVIENGRHEFCLCLAGGLVSRKTIVMMHNGRFRIVNHIDESVQTLSQEQLYTHSNIGEAMRIGAFVVSN